MVVTGVNRLGVGVPVEGVTYFMASTCSPEAFERLREHAVVLWHPDLGDGSGQVPTQESAQVSVQVSGEAVTGPVVAGGATVELDPADYYFAGPKVITRAGRCSARPQHRPPQG